MYVRNLNVLYLLKTRFLAALRNDTKRIVTKSAAKDFAELYLSLEP